MGLTATATTAASPLLVVALATTAATIITNSPSKLPVRHFVLSAKRLGQIGSRMGDEERECESLISSVFIVRQQMTSSYGRALAAGMEASTWAHL